MTDLTASPLIVLVSGGGPVGLTFSLNLAMMMGKHVKIIIYEGRWFVDENNVIRWRGEEQGNTRRDQVVTLQDHVIQQMPVYVQKGLFQNYDERVWPTSRNIPIREVEDRLFALIQPFVQNGQVELIAEQLQEQTERLIEGNFDMLIGADGSNSFVRRYCNIPMISEGVEYACGVAYNIPEGVPPSEEPLHQALNCVLTIAQTRYLVNSSASRRGYLNIRLIQSEYNELRECLQEFQSRNESLDLLDIDKCPNSTIGWTIVRQGLEFFKISPKYVFRVVPIEINVRHASIVIRELRFEVKENANDQVSSTSTNGEQKKYKTILACLAGDAALNVHFWPGRGMNSGMKAAMALARNILRSCTSRDSSRTIVVRTPLRFLDFLEYEGFMARLRAREQQGRSLRVLINPIDQSVIESYSYDAMNQCMVTYKKNLIQKLKDMRQRLVERSDWPHQARPITDEELKYASNRVSPNGVAQLSLANPWPTREMSGMEVTVEDTFPFDQNNFLNVPQPAKVPLTRIPSVFIRQQFLSLWIVDEPISENIKKLLDDVQNLPGVALFSSSPSIHTLEILPKNVSVQLVVVDTIAQAKQWMVTNRELIRKPGNFFKVVTISSLTNQMTAIHLIQVVRSEEPHVPILIYTNQREEIRAALEFPNVSASDTLFDIYEFIGANQHTQWNPGCRVKNVNFDATPEEEKQQLKPTAASQNNLSDHELSNEKSTYPKTCSSDASTLPITPFLLWMDSHDNDPKVIQRLRTLYPQLEIRFVPKFNQASAYLKDNLEDIRHRPNVLVICHSIYNDEKKNVIDVAHLIFDELKLNIPLGVYTRSQALLHEKIPNIPKHIQIFEKRAQLLAFVQSNLNK